MKKALMILTILTLAIFLVGCAKQTAEPTAMPLPTRAELVETGVIEDVEPVEEPVIEEPVDEVEEPEIDEEPEVVEMSMERQQSKARGIAREYIENMAGYTKYNGREIDIGIPVHSGCEGCFLIDASFTRDHPDLENKTDGVKVHLDIEDWKVDSYTFK